MVHRLVDDASAPPNVGKCPFDGNRFVAVLTAEFLLAGQLTKHDQQVVQHRAVVQTADWKGQKTCWPIDNSPRVGRSSYPMRRSATTRAMIALGVMSLGFAAGCAIARAPGGPMRAAESPVGHRTPYVKRVRIIELATARKLGLHGREQELRFGPKQDGTALVLDFLERAQRRGARYVSDIRIELAVPRGGQPALCATRLLPFARGMRVPVTHTTPGHIEQRMVPKLVTRTVNESVSDCKSESHPVTRYETRYETHYETRYTSQYDYSCRCSRMVSHSVPVSRSRTVPVTHYETRYVCRQRPVTRLVTRYEHQLVTRFIPPRTQIIAKHFTDFDLVQATPQCRPLDSGARGGARPHRIVGIVYAGPKQ